MVGEEVDSATLGEEVDTSGLTRSSLDFSALAWVNRTATPTIG